MNTKTQAHGTIFAACLAAAALTGLFSGSAFSAQPDAPPPSKTVKFQDLSVSTPDGVEALYRRIHVAAREVCRVEPDRALADVAQEQKCANEAELRAIKHVNAPALTAYYQAKTGRSVPTLASNAAK